MNRMETGGTLQAEREPPVDRKKRGCYVKGSSVIHIIQDMVSFTLFLRD